MNTRFALPALVLSCLCLPALRAGEHFCIEVVDEASGRGVPLVQLETTDKARYYTDSNGCVAFHEPGLMGEEVWFSVSSHGYIYPRESFGARGEKLKVSPGGKAQLKIRRVNIAERLYRVTGRGIYRDTILLGRQPPLENDKGALNGRVMGQDTVQTALYRDKLYWFWGDTNRPSHPLGNFLTSGAVSSLSGQGGLDPSIGVNLQYFADPKSGFARAMVPRRPGESNPVWIDGLLTVSDDDGRQRLLAHYSRVKGLKAYERGLLLYDDKNETFEEFKQIPLDARLGPGGHPLRVESGGQEYFYFPLPYPVVRVRNDWASVSDIAAYEGFTCLKDGSVYSKENPPLDRGADGKLVWKWRGNTQVLGPKEIEELIKSKAIKEEETPFRLRNVDDGKPVRLHGSSVYWNEYRRRWVMIGLQQFGESFLGEVWFAEANAPEGPWLDAKKIATHAKPHDKQDFYNPMQHPYFAQDGGKLIYFEGTYVNTFSGNPFPTPNYDYNQLMYRLDLSDPRLKLPEPPPGASPARPSKLGP